MLGAGFSLPASMFVPDLVTWPLTAAAITLREHALRDDQSRTYPGTLAHMASEYRWLTHQRRQFYRRQHRLEHEPLTWRAQAPGETGAPLVSGKGL